MSEPTAEWTPHPIAERAITDERRQVVGDRRVGWALAVAALGLCPLSCVGASLSVGGPAFPLIAIALFVALGAEKLRRGARTNDLARAKRRALREDDAGIVGWAVEMTVFQGAAPTGRDRGMLWFEDGRLFFVGERTSFGLTPPQVERGMREEWPLSGLRATSTLRLRHRTAAGEISLGLDFIPADLAPYAPLEKEFRRALDDWLRPSPGGSPAEGQTPAACVRSRRPRPERPARLGGRDHGVLGSLRRRPGPARGRDGLVDRAAGRRLPGRVPGALVGHLGATPALARVARPPEARRPMRVAEWTLDPVVERRASLARRRETRRLLSAWILTLGGLGLCPFACFRGSGVAPLIGIGILMAAAFAASGRSDVRRERRAALREEFGAVNGWLVDLMVLQGDAPTGRDQGIVWFEGERLMFLGGRTSFALSPGATFGSLRETSAIPGLRRSIVLALAHRTAAGRVAINFEFLPPYEESYPVAQGDGAFRRALRGWKGSPSEEEGRLPPLTVGPDIPCPGAFFRRALFTTAFWLAFLGFCGWLGGATQDWSDVLGLTFVLTLLVLACPATRAPRLDWRAWRDRRRLERRGAL